MNGLRTRPSVLLTLALMLILTACSRDETGTLLPDLVVTSVSPDRIPPEGGTLTITGEHFFEATSGTGFSQALSVTVCGVPLRGIEVVGEERVVLAPPSHSVAIRQGGTLTGTLPAFEATASGDVVVTRPDGATVTLTDGVRCDDPASSVGAPTFASTPVLDASEGEPYRYDVLTTDLDGDPITVTAPTLPSWLTLADAGDGTATLAGTPAPGDAGNHPVTLRASDGTAHTEQTFILVVRGTNVDLASLEVSTGTLEPGFDPDVASYTVAVPFETTSIAVTATTASADAALAIDGVSVARGVPSEPIALPVGDTTIRVVVGAEDGVTTRTTTLTVTRAPAPGTVLWTHQFGTSSSDYANDVAVDGSGNVIVAGVTPEVLGGGSAGNEDGYVRKLDADGTEVWTRQFGTGSDDDASGVAVDGSGNVFVTGYEHGTVAGGRDAYVRKLDANGDELWIRRFGTSRDESASDVAVAPSGNVVVAGETSGALEGGSAGGGDAYVRMFDADGHEVWTRQFGTSSFESAYAVAVDASGNVIVAGVTRGGIEGRSAGSFDAFVRMFDAAGNVLWTHQFGSSDSDFAFGVAVGRSGQVIVVGETNGAVEGSNAGAGDAFVRTLDADGDVLWTRQFGSSGHENVRGVAVDASDNVLVTGHTSGALEGTGVGDSDVFVRKLDAGGDEVWTRQYGDPGSGTYAWGGGVAVDDSGNVLVTGSTFGALAGSNAGNSDAFVRKVSP